MENKEIVINKTNVKGIVIGVMASLLALILAITIIVVALNIKKEEPGKLATPTVMAEGMENDSTSTAQRGKVDSFEIILKASHEIDGVDFEFKWFMQVDDGERESVDYGDSNSDFGMDEGTPTNKFILHIVRIGEDSTAVIEAEVRATDGTNKSNPATFKHTVKITASDSPDVENEIRVTKDLDVIKDSAEEDTHPEGGRYYGELNKKLDGADKIEFDVNALVDGESIKVGTFFNKDGQENMDGNASAGIHYMFKRIGEDYTVYVNVGNGTDTSKAQEYNISASVIGERTKVAFLLTFGEESTVTLYVGDKKIDTSEANIYAAAGDVKNMTSFRSVWLSGWQGVDNVHGVPTINSVKLSAPA